MCSIIGFPVPIYDTCPDCNNYFLWCKTLRIKTFKKHKIIPRLYTDLGTGNGLDHTYSLFWRTLVVNDSRFLEYDSSDFIVPFAYIDGACRRNGQPGARASWGISFGRLSSRNACAVLPRTLPQTSSRAELEALHQVLTRMTRICQKEDRIQHVIIASDSTYIVNAVTEWWWDWSKRGGRKKDGEKVKYWETWVQIAGLVGTMEGNGVRVLFVKIGREENEADRLANRALDREEKTERKSHVSSLSRWETDYTRAVSDPFSPAPFEDRSPPRQWRSGWARSDDQNGW